MARKAAPGSGSIRRKIVTHADKQYAYWEARVTTGRDPGTGRQLQKSFTGKTQKEVREKLQSAAVALNSGTYNEPSKLTVGQWLDLWADEYLTSVKPSTLRLYKIDIRKHIKPALGAVRLADLHPSMIQAFVNGLNDLAPATIRLAFKVLHQALEKAVKLGYIPKNPAEGCELPRLIQKEIRPLDDSQAAILMDAARDGPLEILVPLALFTGCRLSEMLGLTWDCISFNQGTIKINKQLDRAELRQDSPFTTPKNGRSRTLNPARSVFLLLYIQKDIQSAMRRRAGDAWSNPNGLVFTGPDGAPLEHWTVGHAFHALTKSVGMEGIRFHDLRHTYAVNALRAGDDIKTIQGNLGHATAAFTLDKYAHFTEQMRQDSAQRMEGFIRNVLKL